MATVDGWRPENTLPEVAFAGRSNVGKSSLLNRLVRRKAFARVSRTPGRTITLWTALGGAVLDVKFSIAMDPEVRDDNDLSDPLWYGALVIYREPIS